MLPIKRSKSLAETLLPVLISNEQTVYVKERFICEIGRLISDITEVNDLFNIDGFLVTIDIKKTFDSLNHYFILIVLKKFGFGINLLIGLKSF